MINLLNFLAQTTQPAQPGSSGGMPGIFSNPLIPIIVIILIFYFFIFRGQRKDKKQREEMLNNVRKNDQVITIGGLMGTVMQVREQEVTIKIDESNNTKIDIARWAIKTVIPDQG
jgi:preprotein translocase subunit YajC